MAHYYDEIQNSPLREEEIRVNYKGQTHSFFTASGLFSREHLDIATSLLIEKSNIPKTGTILDLGCGWGPVAILLKKNNPSLQIYASDINIRALQYTRKNATRLRADIEIIKSDVCSAFKDEFFDCILTNPPYVAGRKIVFQFLEESFVKLKQSGTLQVVARHNKGGKMISEKMNDIFGNVETIAIKSGFRIYQSIKP